MAQSCRTTGGQRPRSHVAQTRARWVDRRIAIKPVPVSKDENRQQPIPAAWRSTFVAIVESLMDGKTGLMPDVVGVRPITAVDAARIASAIQDYGATLVSLPEDTWNSSVCQWMLGYWDVLIDLFTVEEGASDLVLTARVWEEDAGYAFEVRSVHVP